MPTKIQWAAVQGKTGEVWNPGVGCTAVSRGCDNCYAAPFGHRLAHNPDPEVADAYAGVTQHTENGTEWTGTVNLLPARLQIPLRWRKPRGVFVNSMSDLFHKDYTADYIAAVFAVMALTPRHTYQILTKRPGPMASLLTDDCKCGSGHTPGTHFRSKMAWAVSKANPNRIPGVPDNAEELVNLAPWPLPHVWLGVSIEDQESADLRIPHLLRTPAAVRWISAEPLLGPVDLDGPIVPGRGRPKLTYWLTGRPYWDETRANTTPTGLKMMPLSTGPRLDWVVAGGETGPGARTPHPLWFETMAEQCANAGVPFWFKQWGSYGPDPRLTDTGTIDTTCPVVTVASDGTTYRPEDIAPGGAHYGKAHDAPHDKLTAMYRVGKDHSGNGLNGRTYEQFPDQDASPGPPAETRGVPLLEAHSTGKDTT